MKKNKPVTIKLIKEFLKWQDKEWKDRLDFCKKTGSIPSDMYSNLQEFIDWYEEKQKLEEEK